MKVKKPYTLKIYKKYKTDSWKHWKNRKFPNFGGFEKFIWKLFEKGYEIAETSDFVFYVTGAPDIVETEVWICNKREKKCYLFKPVTDEESDLFDFLHHFLPRKRKIKHKEIKELRKKKEELLKKRGEMIKKLLR